jgi:CheY-like chemotaxis protein
VFLRVSLVEELGHTGCSASNLDEALALLNTDQSFDLLFTDLGLHGHDQAGLRLAVEAFRIRKNLRLFTQPAKASQTV